MKKSTLILALFLIIFTASAQKLSIRSKEIKAAFERLNNHPDSKKDQLYYLDTFPDNQQDFIAVFNPSDYGQLYDGHDYINAFLKLDQYYPARVISKAINIGKGLTWDADAINYLQSGIVDLCNRHIKIFIRKLKSLSPKEQSHFITFLADVENYSAYPAYKQLIKALTAVGEKDLADRFKEAMLKREKEHRY